MRTDMTITPGCMTELQSSIGVAALLIYANNHIHHNHCVACFAIKHRYVQCKFMLTYADAGIGQELIQHLLGVVKGMYNTPRVL